MGKKEKEIVGMTYILPFSEKIVGYAALLSVLSFMAVFNHIIGGLVEISIILIAASIISILLCENIDRKWVTFK
jgi:hypothetical protein